MNKPKWTFANFVHHAGPGSGRSMIADYGYFPIGKHGLLVLLTLHEHERITSIEIAELIKAPIQDVGTMLWRLKNRGMIKTVRPKKVPYQNDLTKLGRKTLAAGLAALAAWDGV
jgi:DNA-binding MarR family transcriptional regulator